jgi:small subunit ribosomal protein S18
VSETTASTENAPEPAATTAPAPSESAPSVERESRPSYGDRDSGSPSGGDRGRDERPRRRSGGGGGGRFGRRRVCSFCVDKVDSIDYKEPAKLRRYISDRGKIEPRRKTGTCAKHQRMLTLALKRARHVALLPFTAQHIQLTGVFPTRS